MRQFSYSPAPYRQPFRRRLPAFAPQTRRGAQFTLPIPLARFTPPHAAPPRIRDVFADAWDAADKRIPTSCDKHATTYGVAWHTLRENNTRVWCRGDGILPSRFPTPLPLVDVRTDDVQGTASIDCCRVSVWDVLDAVAFALAPSTRQQRSPSGTTLLVRWCIATEPSPSCRPHPLLCLLVCCLPPLFTAPVGAPQQAFCKLRGSARHTPDIADGITFAYFLQTLRSCDVPAVSAAPFHARSFSAGHSAFAFLRRLLHGWRRWAGRRQEENVTLRRTGRMQRRCVLALRCNVEQPLAWCAYRLGWLGTVEHCGAYSVNAVTAGCRVLPPRPPPPPTCCPAFRHHHLTPPCHATFCISTYHHYSCLPAAAYTTTIPPTCRSLTYHSALVRYRLPLHYGSPPCALTPRYASSRLALRYVALPSW